MLFFLYLATALLLLCLVHRFVRRLSRIAALVLLLIPMGLTGPALLTGRIYGPVDHLYQEVPLKTSAPHAGIPFGARNASAIDVISEFFPWRRAVQASLERREWPLWNGYNLCGHPLAAEAQSAPYSPFTLIACLLLPATISLTYSASVGLFLAALCAYLLARELGCGDGPALFAAAAWALSPSIVIYIQTAMGLTTIYMPLMLLAARRAVREPGIGSGALLATAITLTALEGHPESLFLNVLVGCVYGAFELVRHRGARWRALVTAIAGGIVAALLTAIFLLPLIEAMPQSVEFHSRSGQATTIRHGVPVHEFLANLATDLYPHLHVRHWKRPRMGFIGVETAAVGSLALAFAAYAVWRKRSAETWFFVVFAIVCAIIGARWTPIVLVLQRVPLLSITHHERLAFAAALALILLAAIGVEEMLRRRDFRAAGTALGVVFGVLALGLAGMSQAIALDKTAADYGRYRLFAEAFFLFSAAWFLFVVRRAQLVLPTLLLLLLGQRWLGEYETFGTYRPELAYPPIPILEPLREVREPFRIVGVRGAFPPAMNTFYELEDPRGYEALTLDPFTRTWKLWCVQRGIWFNAVDDLSRPFLSFLNVRYAMQAGTLPVPAGWREVARQRGAVLLENERVIERIFVPRRVVRSDASSIEIVDRLAGITDFRDLAYVSSKKHAGEHVNGPGRIALRSYSVGGRYRFDAEMQRDGYVVISDSAWKGWRATVDGKRVRLHRANAAFLAVHVPAGRHDVRLVYRPKAFVYGRAITFTTLVAIAVFAVLHRFRRRSRWQGDGRGPRP